MDPIAVAVGGATLALVLLGLRTLFGAMVGHDHVITHISGRLIPATAMALATRHRRAGCRTHQHGRR